MSHRHGRLWIVRLWMCDFEISKSHIRSRTFQSRPCLLIFDIYIFDRFIYQSRTFQSRPCLCDILYIYLWYIYLWYIYIQVAHFKVAHVYVTAAETHISRRHGSLLLCHEHFLECARTGDSGIISYMSFSHVNASWLTYEGVRSHVWLSRVTHMNKSCLTHVSESCLTCEGVMSHMWMRGVTLVNESFQMCEWDMSHVWMRHVTRMNESCLTCEGVVSHIWMSHV